MEPDFDSRLAVWIAVAGASFIAFIVAWLVISG